MKKLLAIILAMLMVAALAAGCGCEGEPPEPPPVDNACKDCGEDPCECEEPPPPPPVDDMAEVKKYLEDNFDNFNIDGSTSMIPLHQSLGKKFSSDEDKSHGYIWHSRTVDAFNMFIDGDRDILLGVDYSGELLQKAAAAGVKVANKAITREAFVFLINKNNPVQSLTVEQIKGIYSGEITNWKELGGDDAEIHAFQRNSDSGSQMRMVMFMGDTPLTDAEPEYIEGAMGGIIEQIADFDQGKYSIAYNMYTFTEKQYTNPEVVLLEVDGVKPTDETIFDDSYPIVIYNYIWYDERNTEAAKFAENLHKFLMSDEGQKFISDAGYVNMNKFHDRKLIDLPWYEIGETWVDFHDPDKGEFYAPDGNGNLLVFDNYADYILYGSEYINNAKAREFLTKIYNSEIPMTMYTAEYQSYGVIRINKWFTAVFDPELCFNIRYNGKYYENFMYNINTDRFVLRAFEPWESFDEYFEGWRGFEEYWKDVEPDSVIEITWDDLKDVYFRTSDSDWWHDRPGEPFVLQYYKPFN
jgi:ABC-type phosphate transport system substrate-binding protein